MHHGHWHWVVQLVVDMAGAVRMPLLVPFVLEGFWWRLLSMVPMSLPSNMVADPTPVCFFVAERVKSAIFMSLMSQIQAYIFLPDLPVSQKRLLLIPDITLLHPARVRCHTCMLRVFGIFSLQLMTCRCGGVKSLDLALRESCSYPRICMFEARERVWAVACTWLDG